MFRNVCFLQANYMYVYKKFLTENQNSLSCSQTYCAHNPEFHSFLQADHKQLNFTVRLLINCGY